MHNTASFKILMQYIDKNNDENFEKTNSFENTNYFD